MRDSIGVLPRTLHYFVKFMLSRGRRRGCRDKGGRRRIKGVLRIIQRWLSFWFFFRSISLLSIISLVTGRRCQNKMKLSEERQVLRLSNVFGAILKTKRFCWRCYPEITRAWQIIRFSGRYGHWLNFHKQFLQLDSPQVNVFFFNPSIMRNVDLPASHNIGRPEKCLAISKYEFFSRTGPCTHNLAIFSATTQYHPDSPYPEK